jgi:hypothetical protein
MVRPAMAASVSSTKPDSFSVSVWMATCTSKRSATPGSSRWPRAWCPSPRGASARSRRPRSARAAPADGWRCPCPATRVDRAGVRRFEHAVDVPGARRAGGGGCPSAGPVPPPSIVVMPLTSRPRRLLRADNVDVGVDAPGRGDSMPSPARTSVPGPTIRLGSTPSADVGVARLADAGDAPVLDADIRLEDAPVIDDDARW